MGDAPLAKRDLFVVVQRDDLYALEASPELALLRPLEIAAAVNRLRDLKLEALRLD